MDYWVDAEGEYAIWFFLSGTTYFWFIDIMENLGYFKAKIGSMSNVLEKKCPNNEGYTWSWQFWDDYSWIATNDVYIKCVNEDDFCTTENPCGTDQGDCDIHDECQEGLFCGSNNCPDYLGFHSDFDCCYAPAVEDEHFCRPNDPCAVYCCYPCFGTCGNDAEPVFGHYFFK